VGVVIGVGAVVGFSVGVIVCCVEFERNIKLAIEPLRNATNRIVVITKHKMITDRTLKFLDI
jgi:hypothetical protein